MNKITLAFLVGTISAARFSSQDGGPTWTIDYDAAGRKYVFGAEVASGTDLWLAYSTDCTRTSCDIVEFLTSGAGSIKDAYGTLATPRTDFLNDYKNTKVTKSDGGNTYVFSAERNAAPTDTIGKDFKLEPGQEYEFTWLLKPSGDTGTWTLKLNEDGSVFEAPKPQPAPGPGPGDGAGSEEPTGAIALAASSVAVAAVMSSLF
jgi:hypothetical protein